MVVNRSMSLDGFIAGPGDAMDWIFDFVAPDAAWLTEIAAATGAMLVGRRTDQVGDKMDANEERGAASSDESYPFSGPTFVLTHRPPDPPAPDVTYLSGDIGEAVATALEAAGGKNLEILGADVAGQCLRRGLVDEILVYVLPVLLGDGIRFYTSPGLARIDLEPLDSTRHGAVTILRFRVRKQSGSLYDHRVDGDDGLRRPGPCWRPSGAWPSGTPKASPPAGVRELARSGSRSVGVPQEEWADGALHRGSRRQRRPGISFLKVPEPKVAKNRVHLDVQAGGGRGEPREVRWPRVTEAVERLTRGGRDRHPRGHPGRDCPTTVVMADPEGNEFCVLCDPGRSR